MKKIFLFILLGCSLSAYSIPTYYTDVLTGRTVNEVLQNWGVRKIERTERGWTLHSTNFAIEKQTQYLTLYHYWLVWECKDGTCENL